MFYAYCWASGLIGFGSDFPDGAIVFAESKNLIELKDFIEVKATLSYDNESLVPGVPEADTEREKLEALEKWLDWLKSLATKQPEKEIKIYRSQYR